MSAHSMSIVNADSFVSETVITCNNPKCLEKKIAKEKRLYDTVSSQISQLITKSYSTSFSLGILCLDVSIRRPIYQIYGFVRIADEIVDSFHGYDKKALLDDFEKDTYKSISQKISTNPVLNSFQEVVNRYHIDRALIESFLYSMRLDLEQQHYNQELYQKYIYGSAEVVGLMCLYVFVNGDRQEYERLKPQAVKLGSAFQIINFLRDLNADTKELGRLYFPNLALNRFDEEAKHKLLIEIDLEFDEAYKGIQLLPKTARFGVYVAYVYYRSLANKIKSLPANQMMTERIRIHNIQKIYLLLKSYLLFKLRLIL